MDQNGGTQQFQPTYNATNQGAHKKNKLGKFFIGILILILTASTAFFAYSWKLEMDKVAKHEQAAMSIRELVETVDNEVYSQFTKLDERGHWVSTMTCGEIVASNNYEETKPEYVRMVNNGICDQFSDVWKPNYTAFTPALQKKTSSINNIYKDLGVQELPTFSDKPNTNYLFDTCWEIIETGECDLDATF